LITKTFVQQALQLLEEGKYFEGKDGILVP
jgi:hypothetical protein